MLENWQFGCFFNLFTVKILKRRGDKVLSLTHNLAATSLRSIYYCRSRWEITVTSSDKLLSLRSVALRVPFRNYTDSVIDRVTGDKRHICITSRMVTTVTWNNQETAAAGNKLVRLVSSMMAKGYSDRGDGLIMTGHVLLLWGILQQGRFLALVARLATWDLLCFATAWRENSVSTA